MQLTTEYLISREMNTLFFAPKRMMYSIRAAQCSQAKTIHNKMKILIQIISIRERLAIVFEEEPRRKPVRVRGHIRVVNGRKVYVKAHYRRR